MPQGGDFYPLSLDPPTWLEAETAQVGELLVNVSHSVVVEATEPVAGLNTACEQKEINSPVCGWPHVPSFGIGPSWLHRNVKMTIS